MADFFLCRPDDNHWCVECCRIRNCCLLGDVGEGKMGCQDHNGKVVGNGLTQSLFCKDDYDCLLSNQLERREELLQIVAKLPPGEFKVSDVLRVLEEATK